MGTDNMQVYKTVPSPRETSGKECLSPQARRAWDALIVWIMTITDGQVPLKDIWELWSLLFSLLHGVVFVHHVFYYYVLPCHRPKAS